MCTCSNLSMATGQSQKPSRRKHEFSFHLISSSPFGVFLSVYMCVYMCVCMCVYACMWVYVYVCMYVCLSVGRSVCRSVGLSVCMCACASVCIYVRTYLRTYVRMYVCLCVYSTCDILYLYVIIPPGRGATRGLNMSPALQGLWGLSTGCLRFI